MVHLSRCALCNLETDYLYCFGEEQTHIPHPDFDQDYYCASCIQKAHKIYTRLVAPHFPVYDDLEYYHVEDGSP